MSDDSTHEEGEENIVEVIASDDDDDDASPVAAEAVQDDDDTDDEEIDDAQDADVVVADGDEAEVDADDNSGQEEEEVVAEVIVEAEEDDGEQEEEEEAVAVPMVVEEEEGNNGDDEEESDEEDDEPISSLKKKAQPKGEKVVKKSSTPKKKSKSKTKKAKRHSGEDSLGMTGYSLDAASAAREMLLQTVPSLPIRINESFVVRSFGQLNVQSADKFSTSSALYPVGFCCDRYEFSPVHGRVLKFRCGILDGKRSSLEYDGPVFRVMWGQGVDEDVDKVDYPYDPYTNSAPIASPENGDVVAVPASVGGNHEIALPTAGMRVKVRFEKDQYYYGTIQSVEEDEGEKKKKKRRSAEISIAYDDGFTEEAVFPDPDIMLVMPGMYTHFD